MRVDVPFCETKRVVLGATGDYLRNQHAMGGRRKIFACDFMKRRSPRYLTHRWRRRGPGRAHAPQNLL